MNCTLIHRIRDEKGLPKYLVAWLPVAKGG